MNHQSYTSFFCYQSFVLLSDVCADGGGDTVCDTIWYLTWHDPSICVTWLSRICMTWDLTQSHVYVITWHEPSCCVTWLNRVCMTWRINMCDMPRDCAPIPRRHKASWLSHMCDMTESYVWRDLFWEICMTWWGLYKTHTHTHTSRHTYDKRAV